MYIVYSYVVYDRQQDAAGHPGITGLILDARSFCVEPKPIMTVVMYIML